MRNATKQPRLTPKQRRRATLLAAVEKAEKDYAAASKCRREAMHKLTDLWESLRRINYLIEEEERATV
jgi:hypothetical protein